MTLKPLDDRVVILRDDCEETSKGGIILPNSAKEQPAFGEVISVGPGKTDQSGNAIPMQVVVGNKVIFGKYSGTEVSYNHEDYIVMRQEDILAIVETSTVE